MEFFLNRYRNLSVLLVAILVQLALLAYQVKSNQDVRLIRVWTMAAVTPLARMIEGTRRGVTGFSHDYLVVLDVRAENKRLKAQLDRSEIENQYLHAEIATADRTRSLAILQSTSPFPTVAARVSGYTTDPGGKTAFIDRGASSGLERGMAVITAEGIVGKIIDVYPSSANVLLITDASFAAGVKSGANGVQGVLKGQGRGTVLVEYVQNEEKVEQGDWFITLGQDFIFPPGLKVGQVAAVRQGTTTKEISLTPSGLQNGLEEVLIVTGGVQRGTVAEAPVQNQPVHMLSGPASELKQEAKQAAKPGETTAASVSMTGQGLQNGSIVDGSAVTDLDRVTQRLRLLGPLGDKNRPAPNFNAPPAAGNNDTPRPAAQPTVVSPVHP
jgi:rod shape-determining protein MreC